PGGRLDGWDAVVAAGTGDFLDEVDSVGDVRAPTGHGHGQTVLADDIDGRADAFEQSGHLGGGVVDTDKRVHALDREFDDGRLGGLTDLRSRRAERSAAEFDEQVRAPTCGHRPEPRVDAAFEAARGGRGQFVATGSAGNRDRVEVSGLDDDFGRLVVDLDVGAAHDSGQADDLSTLARSTSTAVGDEQILGIERALDIVESRELLP